MIGFVGISSLAVEIGGWDDAIHQPDALGLGCQERVARQQVLLGARRIHGERPDGCAAVAGGDADAPRAGRRWWRCRS